MKGTDATCEVDIERTPAGHAKHMFSPPSSHAQELASSKYSYAPTSARELHDFSASIPQDDPVISYFVPIFRAKIRHRPQKLATNNPFEGTIARGPVEFRPLSILSNAALIPTRQTIHSAPAYSPRRQLPSQPITRQSGHHSGLRSAPPSTARPPLRPPSYRFKRGPHSAREHTVEWGEWSGWGQLAEEGAPMPRPQTVGMPTSLVASTRRSPSKRAFSRTRDPSLFSITPGVGSRPPSQARTDIGRPHLRAPQHSRPMVSNVSTNQGRFQDVQPASYSFPMRRRWVPNSLQLSVLRLPH
jgi:hypothetical protein